MRTHAQPAAKQAPAAQATVARPEPAGVARLLHLQRSYGNQSVRRALFNAIQPKLLVHEPGDRYEQEADRVADLALRLPAPAVQRKCSCTGEGGGCDECKRKAQSQAAPVLRRKAAAPAPPAAPTAAPPSVEAALRTPGQPLPETTRTEMELRLGGDFTRVLVHDDAEGHRSARDVAARAYTVGHHVVFARGQYQPGTHEGRRLLTHELVHVVQQSGQPPARQSVQRQSEPLDSWGWLGDQALDSALGVSQIPGPLRGAAAAAIRGFAAEVRSQFSGNKEAIAGHLKQLASFTNLKSLFGGYYGGLLAGIISPLTGLWDMLVLVDRLRVFVQQLADDAANRFAEVIEGAKAMVAGIGEAAAAVKTQLSVLLAHPIDLIVALVNDKGPSKLEAAANQAGHDAVKSMAGSVAKRFSPEQPAEARGPEASPLARVDVKIEHLKESLFSTPWSKVGYDIGYGVGFAAVNILLLVYSAGVGTVLTRLGSVLGELGGALGNVGKLVGVIGRGITMVENAIAAVMNVALKPLQPVLRALEPHLQKLVVFLRRLLGIAEKESVAAAAAGAKTTAAVAKPKVPVPKPHAPSPKPHAPGQPTGAKPAAGAKSAKPTAPEPKAPKPKAPEPQAAKPKAAEPPARAKPPAKAEPHLDPNEAKALERTRNVEKLDPAMIDDEVNAARKVKSRPPTEEGYVEEKVLPNGHKWRKKADGSGWCRFSGKPPKDCVPSLDAPTAPKPKAAKPKEAKPKEAKPKEPKPPREKAGKAKGKEGTKAPPARVGKLPRQVQHGSTPLSKETIAYRRAHPHITGDHNLVAIEYSIGGVPQKVKVFPNESGLWHSEPAMDDFIRKLEKQHGKANVKVNGVYSERQPCGPSQKNCEALVMGERYADADVTFGFPYQAEAGRGPGTRAAEIADQLTGRTPVRAQQPPTFHEISLPPGPQRRRK